MRRGLARREEVHPHIVARQVEPSRQTGLVQRHGPVGDGEDPAVSLDPHVPRERAGRDAMRTHGVSALLERVRYSHDVNMPALPPRQTSRAIGRRVLAASRAGAPDERRSEGRGIVPAAPSAAPDPVDTSWHDAAVGTSGIEEDRPCDDLPADPGRFVREHDWTSLQVSKATAVRDMIDASRAGFDVYLHLCDGA